MSLHLLVLALLALHPAQQLDERPAQAGEWGFRPAEGLPVERTPPAFSWRPQKGAARYELQASRDAGFERIDYAAGDVSWNVHCPTRVFEAGSWAWRFRAVDAEGEPSAWSRVRHFEVPVDARAFVLPARAELLARIPDEHPRLFLRPEDLPGLRARASGSDAQAFAALLARGDQLLASPPSTTEPVRYAEGMQRGSDPWRAVWWGNRKATIEVLEGASTLAFLWRVSERPEYGALARRLLLECARWDPHGATGYRYNDEAGMPYAYHFSRTYTLLAPLLDERERATCRAVMRTRGREMYAHLAPAHLWRPYSSHSNRAWHFLGEVGIAFHGEIPEADDWVWFAANVFACAYPVWADDDGGWHEGTAYWKSYLGRFTWWADVQRSALGLDAYQLPYFSRAGDWALYVMPPGTRGGGFGDQNPPLTSAQNLELMTVLAAQAASPHWRWYVDQHGGPHPGSGWIGFLRGSLPQVEARAPDDLPTSRSFTGTGIAVLQSSLRSAEDNVQLLFKSSPFGTQSHGFESQNSFLLSAFGERLILRSGRRDSYGSAHHREWMWQTRSSNSITVDGRGQEPHSASALGRLTGFHTQPGAHWVEGEAAAAYGGRLERFRRAILFLEPDLILIHDRLRALEPATFEWRLHAPTPFEEQAGLHMVTSGAAAVRIEHLIPEGLRFTQTDRFDTPPRERIQLVEHHLTASTPQARSELEFLTVLRVFRKDAEAPGPSRLERSPQGLLIDAPLGAGRAILEIAPGGALRARALDASGAVLLELDTSRVEHTPNSWRLE